MRKKPDPQDEPEIARHILEKLWMGRNWGHNHIEEDDVPKGLPKDYPTPHYHYVKHELRRKQLLVPFREHGKDLYVLNTALKAEIEKRIGVRVEPKSKTGSGA